VTRPAISVLLIRRRVDTAVLAEALRSGMREVVEERDITGIGSAVQRAHQVWAALNGGGDALDEGQQGKLVTVFSPKGGVGKTTISVNLATALARSRDKKVCLVDLDLAFGDVAITLQLLPSRTIGDAVEAGDGLDFTVLEPLLTRHESGLFALVAPVQPDARDLITPELVGKILGLLKAHFDWVVVDSAPAFDDHILQAFDQSDDLLLVTALDVPTLKNVKVAIETLNLLNFPHSRRHLVLNRADDKVGLTSAKVESTLGMKVEASIPTSTDVAQATNAGDPIVSAHPRHSASQAILKLSESLGRTPDNRDAKTHSKSRPVPAKRGLLRRTVGKA